MKFRYLRFITSFLAAGLLSAQLQACDKPAAPVLPEPESAVLAEMVKAQKDVKAYVAAATDFLACVKNNRQYNDMVDEMKAVGEDFNSRIRKFKELKQQ